MPVHPIPSLRVEALNDAPIRRGGHVLYWMTAARRPHHHFGLQYAAARAEEFAASLWIFEPLSCRDRWASRRFHRFVLDGMEDHDAAFARQPVTYFPWVAPDADADRGLLEALAEDAALVVTDWFPSYFMPRMQRAVAGRLPVRLERVDSNGIVPLAAPTRTWKRAHDFRRWTAKEGAAHLAQVPRADPFEGVDLPRPRPIPEEISRRWPPARFDGEGRWIGDLTRLPVDAAVRPTETRGGWRAARLRLDRFLADGLGRYAEEARHPDAEATSGLSPWLHFGHLSAHEVLGVVAEAEGRDPLMWADTSSPDPKAPFRGVSPGATAFLDQLVTWRELGLSLAHRCDDPAAWRSIPAWARETLDAHADDPRPVRYDLDTLEAARTADPVWNAAQRQLLRDGVIHNYLRMGWGKRILEWTASPRDALEVMVHLNDRWALDGRDPNSYNGIGWVLGRFDRPWGPERPIFGKVRYMTSAATRKKLRMSRYLARFGGGQGDEP